MPRISRIVIPDEKAAYHVMSRTALDGFPFGPVEKDAFVKILKRFSLLYFTEIIGYCVMSNHFHILTVMHPEREFTDDDIRERFAAFYGEEKEFIEASIPYYRKKWASLSEFMQDVKQTFSRFYNKRHNRRGTLWGERFKSVIVENGDTLVNVLAYIDLNPIRAGIVKRPEKYRWNSIGYHSQTDNKDGFLSLDFGLAGFGQMDDKERFRRYRRHVYEAGAIQRSGGKSRRTINKSVVKKERSKNFESTRTDRFLCKTRYFTDSGIIGSKSFVTEHYQRFKHVFQARKEKKPNPVKGIQGLYSLKRLSA